MTITIGYDEIIKTVAKFLKGDSADSLKDKLSISKENNSLLISYECNIEKVYSGVLKFCIDELTIQDNVLKLKYDIAKEANDIIKGIILLVTSPIHNKHSEKFSFLTIGEKMLNVDLNKISSLSGILAKITVCGQLNIRENNIEFKAEIK